MPTRGVTVRTKSLSRSSPAFSETLLVHRSSVPIDALKRVPSVPSGALPPYGTCADAIPHARSDEATTTAVPPRERRARAARWSATSVIRVVPVRAYVRAAGLVQHHQHDFAAFD